MKNKLISTKNFVKKHRIALAVTGTTGVCLYMNYRTIKIYDEFLKEHGLADQFYAPEV